MNKNNKEYKEVNRTINRKIREAKENWVTKKCKEIERLERVYDSRSIHKTVKEVCNLRKKQHYGLIINKQEKIIITVKEKLARWKEYVKELYQDDRTKPVNIKHAETAPVIK
ncbi:hypothetical protein RN001_008171 [Aquatica leii]|uniref:Uncharacterized protein n=1 Tax=Aquatica leii TaxID=1421715 RepID=A0AAN7Q4Y0_9COLE|nr:hypothetical protein RN001_008171 [Aquatica leii]